MTDSPKTRAPRRSAEQIIEDLNAKLEERKAKLAMQSAQTDPRLSDITNDLKSAEDALLKSRQGLSEGPQSFSSRRTSHELWIEEIEAAEDFATISEDFLKDQVAYLKKGLRSVAYDISKGDFSEESVSKVLENVPQPDDIVAAAEGRFLFAQDRRKTHTEAKKASD